MSSVRLAAMAALVGCASLWAAQATAQVYRIVGPDGKVTFTDRPPASAGADNAAAAPAPGRSASSASLPLVVRNAASRFPVTLYTSTECTPCATARGYLVSRGVPFNERTVTTPADIQALQRLAGEARLPFATIGGQHVVGFSDAEWGQYLDAAGYPKVSQLPASWRNPEAAPLVAVQAPAARPQQAQPAAQAQAPQAEDPLPSDPSPANPTGLRF